MPQKLTTRFRYAKPNDANTIAQIFAASWHNAYCGIIPYKTLNTIIRRRDASWWKKSISRGTNLIVMTFDAKVVGYAGIGLARGTLPKSDRQKIGEITELYIEPDYQGVGLGKELFKASWGELRKRGMSELHVWALVENQKAIDFYCALGGQEVTTAYNQFDNERLKKIAFKWTARDQH